MLDPSVIVLAVIFLLALAFAVSNGFNDAANAIATVIGTRVLSPHVAIIMAASLNFIGAATGTAVAMTFGMKILDPQMMSQEGIGMTIITGALASAVVWTTIATLYGLPISVSHSLVAGLVGSGIAIAGTDIVIWGGKLSQVLAAVICAPTLGFLAGFMVMVALRWIVRYRSLSSVQRTFGKLQIASAAFMAYAHGKNDGQMPMSIMALALMMYYGWSEFHIPYWVIVLSGSSCILRTLFPAESNCKAIVSMIVSFAAILLSIEKAVSLNRRL